METPTDKQIVLPDLIKTIYESLQEEHPLVNNVAWWQLHLENVSGHMEDEEQWPALQKNLKKTFNIWQKNWKKWAVNSLDTLLGKVLNLPAHISAMSLSYEIFSSVINVWTSCVSTEEVDETDCSDFLKKEITSTSSTIALTPIAVAGTSGLVKSSPSDLFKKLANQSNTSGNSSEQTGTMSSSISLYENGESVQYTLEEKVGKYRVTMNVYDGPESLKKEKWYQAPIARITMSVNSKSTKLAVDQMLAVLTEDFMKRKPIRQGNSHTYGKRQRRY
ncbi:NS2 [Mythimna loreyi densovirus]|uniref:NS2 n=1 Tax=Mythimna loreyi densovirus TaxID=185636 RepID=Q6SA34_JCDNV|nr:NS2 [Mythimna loreyi densovirus]AAR30038.1 NS2 [Mythimna loreyi densovirus]